jgi:hypothetical protein
MTVESKDINGELKLIFNEEEKVNLMYNISLSTEWKFEKEWQTPR